MSTHDDGSGRTKGGGDGDRPEGPASTRWWEEGQEGTARGRKGVQVRAIVEAFAAQGVPIGIFPNDVPEDMEYMYRKDVVLTRDVDATRVYQALGQDPTWDKRTQREQPADQPPTAVSGLTVIGLPAQDEDGNVQDAPYWFDRLDRALGVGVAVPDHVVHITGTAGACPATEPTPASGMPQPPIDTDPDTDGRQVKVVVVDTGVLPKVVRAHPWLAGVTGEEEPPSVGHYRGHGTFVSGVVRTMAPATTIEVKAILVVGGAVLESDLAVSLMDALADTPDIISMSAGTTTRGGLPLLALDNFWREHLSHVKGTVLVAAAGNDGDRGPFWPAAFPWSVSVGALDVDGSRAGYSNFGSWVDVYARGSDLVNAYPRGPYTYQEPPLAPAETNFVMGMASWSGTSFSTPLVSGLVAARMTWSGESAREAAASLLRLARENATIGVGAVLEPGMGAPGD